MKKILDGLMVVTFLLVGTAFVWADPYKIGVSAPLTGPVAEVGRYMKNGSLMAIDDMNAQGGILGRKVEVVFGDTEARPEVGVSVYEKFMTKDKVDCVIGGLNSSVNIAMQEAAAKYDKLFVTSGPTSEILRERVRKDPKKYWMYFKTAPPYDAMIPSFRAFFKNLEKRGLFKPEKKTFANIVEDTDFGRGRGGDFEVAMKEEGWKLIANEVVKIDQADYSAQMSKLRALKPDLLFTVQVSPSAAASLCKSFKESGVRAFFMAIYTPSNPDYIKLTGKASETLVWGSSCDWVPAYSKAFLERYRKRFNEEPGQNAGLQYDAMMNVFAAMNLAKSTDPRKIADAMVRIKNKGNFGIYQYDPTTHEVTSGDDFVPVRFYQIVGGKHIAIGPEKFKEAEYIVQEWLK